MKTKVFGLAAIGFVCSVGVAAAQTSPTPSPQTTTLSTDAMQKVLQTLAKQRASASASTAAQTGSRADVQNLSANLALGWNFYHATNCGWFVDSGGNQWFYIFPSEGGIVFTINNLYTSQGLQISCDDGNFFGIFVVDSSSGAYTQTISFTFQ